jgi:hypothetical protein
MRRLLLVIVLLVSLATFARADDKTYLAWRGELALNRTVSASVGASLLNISDKGFMGGAVCAYVSGGVNQAVYKTAYPFSCHLKGGAEATWGCFQVKAELTHYTNFAGQSYMVFTPAGGLSLIGFASLTLGYNVFDENYNVFDLEHVQLSFTVNLSRQLLKEFMSKPAEK